MRLVVPSKTRARLRNVGPFREALSPPFIVIGCGIELRKMERYELGRASLRVDHFTHSCRFLLSLYKYQYNISHQTFPSKFIAIIIRCISQYPAYPLKVAGIGHPALLEEFNFVSNAKSD